MIPELVVHVGFNLPDGFNQFFCLFPRNGAFFGCQLNCFDLGFPVFEALPIKLESLNHESGDDDHQFLVLKTELNRGADVLSDFFPLKMIVSQIINFPGLNTLSFGMPIPVTPVFRNTLRANSEQ